MPREHGARRKRTTLIALALAAALGSLPLTTAQDPEAQRNLEQGLTFSLDSAQNLATDSAAVANLPAGTPVEDIRLSLYTAASGRLSLLKGLEDPAIGIAEGGGFPLTADCLRQGAAQVDDMQATFDAGANGDGAALRQTASKLAADGNVLARTIQRCLDTLAREAGGNGGPPPPTGQPGEGACATPRDPRADNDASNTIFWNQVAGASGYAVFVSAGGGPFELVQEQGSDASSFRHQDLKPGVTYSYFVRAIGVESDVGRCPELEITAVPFLPGMVGVVVGTLCSTGAFVALRRRS